jgi:TRAP transporter TAXI family solute receptor
MHRTRLGLARPGFARFVRALALLLTCVCGALQAEGRPPFQPDGVPPRQFISGDANSTVPTEYFVAIFGGSTQGVYYYAASAICNAMRRRFDEHRIRCVPLRSQGAGSNRTLMNLGRAQMAIVQSDTNYYAATGEVPITGARSVVSLYDELGVLVASKGSRIDRPEALRGHRLNLGAPGSVARELWAEYLGAIGLSTNDLADAFDFPQDVNYDGLCTGFIEGFGLWSGHPVPALAATLERCDARLVGTWHPGVQALLDRRPYYFRGTLPSGTYPGQTEALDAYGIKASLIAHERTLPYIVYWVTRVIIEDHALLRSLHPALAALDPEAMRTKGNFLPPHDGAAHYWRERGFMTGGPAGVPAQPSGDLPARR